MTDRQDFYKDSRWFGCNEVEPAPKDDMTIGVIIHMKVERIDPDEGFPSPNEAVKQAIVKALQPYRFIEVTDINVQRLGELRFTGTKTIKSIG